MHGYWQAVMTLFEQELAGSRGFSLIPLEGLSMVVSPNPQLLLPSKLYWHMPGNRISLPPLNRMRGRRDGIDTQVSILQVEKRRLK